MCIGVAMGMKPTVCIPPNNYPPHSHSQEAPGVPTSNRLTVRDGRERGSGDGGGRGRGIQGIYQGTVGIGPWGIPPLATPPVPTTLPGTPIPGITVQ